MPTYTGPYDVVVVDGREYHRGNNINVSAARLDQLHRIEGYRFEGIDPVPAQAIMSNSRDDAHPPNEFGVPADPNPKTNAAKAQAEAAVPSAVPTAPTAQ